MHYHRCIMLIATLFTSSLFAHKNSPSLTTIGSSLCAGSLVCATVFEIGRRVERSQRSPRSVHRILGALRNGALIVAGVGAGIGIAGLLESRKTTSRDNSKPAVQKNTPAVSAATAPPSEASATPAAQPASPSPSAVSPPPSVPHASPPPANGYNPHTPWVYQTPFVRRPPTPDSAIGLLEHRLDHMRDLRKDLEAQVAAWDKVTKPALYCSMATEVGRMKAIEERIQQELACLQMAEEDDARFLDDQFLTDDMRFSSSILSDDGAGSPTISSPVPFNAFDSPDSDTNGTPCSFKPIPISPHIKTKPPLQTHPQTPGGQATVEQR